MGFNPASNRAVDQYERALELVPGQAYYAVRKGRLYQSVNPPQPPIACFP